MLDILTAAEVPMPGTIENNTDITPITEMKEDHVDIALTAVAATIASMQLSI